MSSAEALKCCDGLENRQAKHFRLQTKKTCMQHLVSAQEKRQYKVDEKNGQALSTVATKAKFQCFVQQLKIYLVILILSFDRRVAFLIILSFSWFT